MKFKNIIKSLPLLSTIFIIIFLSIYNQKEYTKLRILIWDTPSLSLGTYLAISTGSGFVLSYIFTTKLAKKNQYKTTNFINYDVKKEIDENNDYINSDNKIKYENTLIERDINEPSPTINARFRVIGKTERKNESYKEIVEEEYETSKFEQEADDLYYEKNIDYKQENEKYSISNDWNDDSYLNW